MKLIIDIPKELFNIAKDGMLSEIQSMFICGSVTQGTPLLEGEPKWITVTERLPKEDDEYLCTIQTRSIYTDKVIDTYVNFCNFMDGGWGVFDDETVIAWMPLPEPYKAESEE